MTPLGHLVLLALVSLFGLLIYFAATHKMHFPAWEAYANARGFSYERGGRSEPALLTGVFDGRYVTVALTGTNNSKTKFTRVEVHAHFAIAMPEGLRIVKEDLGSSLSQMIGDRDFQLDDAGLDGALNISGQDRPALQRLFESPDVRRSLRAYLRKSDTPNITATYVGYQESAHLFLSDDALDRVVRVATRLVQEIEATLMLDAEDEVGSGAWSARLAQHIRVPVRDVEPRGSEEAAPDSEMDASDSSAGSAVDSLISGLKDSGTAVSKGVFTLDRESALEKIRDFQLATPEAYLLWLVQALVLKGATELRLHLDTEELVIESDGGFFDARDFEQLHADLFAPQPDDAARARQRLALGLNAALRCDPGELSVVSGSAGEAPSLKMRPGAEDIISTHEHDEDGTQIRVQLGADWGTEDGRRTLDRLVKQCCRYADQRILLNGERISDGFHHPGLHGRVRIDLEPIVGVCGFLRSLGEDTELRLVEHGVLVGRDSLGGVAPGFGAIVSDPRCRMDLSLGDIVQNEHHAHLAREVRRAEPRAIRALCDELSAKPPLPDDTRAWAAGVVRGIVRTHTSLYELREDAEALRITETPAYPTVDGSYVSWARLLEHAEEAGHIAYSELSFDDLGIPAEGFGHTEIEPSLTLHLGPHSEPAERCFLFTLLGDQLRPVTTLLLKQPRDLDLLRSLYLEQV